MAAPMDPHDSTMAIEFDDRLCEIEATCPTGFEKVVKEDIEEKLGVEVTPAQGKVFVLIPFKDVTKLLDLYSIDNLYAVVRRYPEFKFAADKDAVMQQIMGIVPELDWEFGLKTWARFIPCEHQVSHKPQDPALTVPYDTETSDSQDKKGRESSETSCKPQLSTDNKSNTDSADGNRQAKETSIDTQSTLVAIPTDKTKADDTDSSPSAKKKAVETVDTTETSTPPARSRPIHNPAMPSFRATCNRAGTSHCFQSPDVARSFGGAIQDYFGWNVKMKNFDIEVVINVDDERIYVSIALTKQSLHRRHIVEFGRCTLRPTIAYAMLRLCGIKSGEVICDPMCGTGSIPIEGAVSWPEAVYLAGDVQKSCVEKTQANIDAINQKRREKTDKPPISIGVANWDATKLPLPDAHVDVFVTDMPFGKRSGSKTNNASLYPQLLKDWARASRPLTGRCCLLTQDRTSMHKTMAKVGKLWHLKTTNFVNIGGIIAGVYLLSRTKCIEYKLSQ